MAYYRTKRTPFRRRSWTGADRARALAASAALHRKYGPALEHVHQTFFELDPGRLDQLLALYGRHHGGGAADYAAKTITSWRRGHVQMSDQTERRLLDLLPQVMTADEKLTLVQRLRAQAAA